MVMLVIWDDIAAIMTSLSDSNKGTGDDVCGDCETVYKHETREYWTLATLDLGCVYIMRPSRISIYRLVHMEVHSMVFSYSILRQSFGNIGTG